MASPAKEDMTLPMWRRLIPVAVLLLGLALFLLLDLERYFSFEMLSHHHATLTAWVAGHVALAAFLFVVIYTLEVAFSLPIAGVVTPVGGFLFGLRLGALLFVIARNRGMVALVPAGATGVYESFSHPRGARPGR